MKNIFDKKYPITKMHGTGNDFVVYVDFEERTTAEDVIKICDRHFGIGSDGVLTVTKSRVKEAKFRMKYFNSDGTTGEMCGNGIRCFAKYLVDNKLVDGEVEISVDTDAGIIIPEVLENSDDKAIVKVNMGKPIFENSKQVTVKVVENGLIRIEVPVYDHTKNKEIKLIGNYIGMGNPHAVFFVDEGEASRFTRDFGSQIENDTKIFPQKTNVEFVELNSKNDITMHVWERAVGITLSCGTGTCAVAVAAISNKNVENEVNVHVPGGVLYLKWAGGDAPIFMTGPAVSVFNINNLNL